MVVYCGGDSVVQAVWNIVVGVLYTFKLLYDSAAGQHKSESDNET
jgi:hypothetical protein